jgi:magnesium-transporting ATPase (P-type)
MVLFENFHVFNCRSEYRSLFRVPLRNNTVLVAGVVLMQGLHILSLHVPIMQEILDLAPVSLEQWFTCLVVAGIVIVVMEMFKWFEFRNGPAGGRGQAGSAA